MSYAEHCLPPLSLTNKAWRKRKCNLWGRNCRWEQNFSGHRRATNKFNKCLITSVWGRPMFKAGGEVCYKKKGAKGKGTEVCAKLDVESNTLGKPYTVHTDPNSIPGGVAQAGLSSDRGTFIDQLEKMDKRLLIGAGVLLVLLAR